MEISAIANGLSIPITVNSALSVTSNIVGVDDCHAWRRKVSVNSYTANNVPTIDMKFETLAF